MIEYFTALVISYTLQDHAVYTTAWFESEKHCQTVMQRDLAQPLYNHILELYGKDIMMHCTVSNKVSKPALKPKPRPVK
jgi:hypothetical protein